MYDPSIKEPCSAQEYMTFIYWCHITWNHPYSSCQSIMKLSICKKFGYFPFGSASEWCMGMDEEQLRVWQEATSVQLPPSMISKLTFPLIVHLVWKMVSLCSCFSWGTRLLKSLLSTNISPSLGPSLQSSVAAFRFSSLLSSSPSSILSATAWFSA